MCDLNKIGFYTLTNKRARQVNINSPLQRCELILTNRCNFNCIYCRGVKEDMRGDISLDDAKKIINMWEDGRLKNIRFSGGEPTLYKNLIEIIKYTKKQKHIKRIALSTNGSAEKEFYHEMYKAGVNDFSISLDACCSSSANIMAGCDSKFDTIVDNIKFLSKLTYVTVGVVLNDKNINNIKGIVEFAISLGVSDVRIITAAQYENRFTNGLDVKLFKRYPILKYRLNNIINNRLVRGIKVDDCHRCHLVKDDMAIMANYHFPCIIYMREWGDPIGSIKGKTVEEIRKERMEWFKKIDIFKNEICRNNCLDVCVDHNNTVELYQESNYDFFDNYNI